MSFSSSFSSSSSSSSFGVAFRKTTHRHASSSSRPPPSQKSRKSHFSWRRRRGSRNTCRKGTLGGVDFDAVDDDDDDDDCVVVSDERLIRSQNATTEWMFVAGGLGRNTAKRHGSDRTGNARQPARETCDASSSTSNACSEPRTLSSPLREKRHGRWLDFSSLKPSACCSHLFVHVRLSRVD